MRTGRLWRVLRAVAFLAAAAFIALCLGTFVPRPLWPQAGSDETPRHRILVLMNPIHTDIAVPIEPGVSARFAFLRDAGQPIDAPGARYIVFGWGGRDFYTQTPTWSELKLAPLLKGLTLDRAVMHVDVVGAIPEPHPEVHGLDLGDADFEALLARIDAGFARGADGPVVMPGFHYSEYDAFYEATGRFTAILGCNTWAAAVLRAGGLRTGWWNPLPETLVVSLKLFN